ncbi:universal stress protein [Gloeocapsopsis dulcis]|uniref:Universal stress protein n=1 Tax=Gloeocapsopsis dulcis AAB1 = 1H9 TaxID=1433147 RepID=A0A6N8G0F8_9CHRO|nr:universal stress protein [Gloeocapsopsis dulcis]MUL38878.1 universal stress protein [Gloeocapsopsis dulcis AAB1 = 1H9]WNN89312.1 universal stress protein [Gloeocapsopsis dulcis]
MYTRILVALDRSPMSEQVFQQAIDVAKATNATVMLLHVLSPDEEGSPDISLMREEYYPGLSSEIAELHRQQWRDFEAQGIEVLRDRSEQARRVGVKAAFEQFFGTPSRAICDYARKWKADLIILGRRGHSGLKELFLGSVSNYVLHHALASVLTIQSNSQESIQDSQKKQVEALP